MDLFLTLSDKNIIILECLLSLTINNIKPLNFYHQPGSQLLGLLGGLCVPNLAFQFSPALRVKISWNLTEVSRECAYVSNVAYVASLQLHCQKSKWLDGKSF